MAELPAPVVPLLVRDVLPDRRAAADGGRGRPGRAPWPGRTRLTNGASAAARAASWCATAVLISWASTRAASGCRASWSTGSRLRRIKSMQSACRRMIARGPVGVQRPMVTPPVGESTTPAGPGSEAAGGGATGDYSPITAQRKPIMMKKPLNRAIRPMPPYGEFAPVCGTSCRPIPKTTAQPMNRNANRNLRSGS